MDKRDERNQIDSNCYECIMNVYVKILINANIKINAMDEMIKMK